MEVLITGVEEKAKRGTGELYYRKRWCLLQHTQYGVSGALPEADGFSDEREYHALKDVVPCIADGDVSFRRNQRGDMNVAIDGLKNFRPVRPRKETAAAAAGK